MDDPVNFTNPSSLVPCVLCLTDPQISDLMGQEHKAMGGGGWLENKIEGRSTCCSDVIGAAVIMAGSHAVAVHVKHADVIMAASHAVAVHLNMVEAWSLFGPWMCSCHGFPSELHKTVIIASVHEGPQISGVRKRA